MFVAADDFADHATGRFIVSRSAAAHVALSIAAGLSARSVRAQEIQPADPVLPYTLEIGNGDVVGGTGTVTVSDIARIIRGQSRGMAACFNREVPIRATEPVRLEVSFTIGDNGRIARAETSTLPIAPGAGSCVSARLRGLVFPAPENGAVELSFPFRFTPLPARTVVRSLVDVRGQVCILGASPSLRCVPIGGGESPNLDLRLTGNVARVVARDDSLCVTDAAGVHRCWGWMPVSMDPPDGSGPFILNVSGGELVPPAMGVNGFGAEPFVLRSGVLTGTAIARDGSTSALAPALPGVILQADHNSRTTCQVEGDRTVTCRAAARGLAVEGVGGAQEVRVGRGHACALLATGEVRCWEVCAPSETDYESPMCRLLTRAAPRSRLRSFPVRLGAPVQQLVIGEFQSCALQSDGIVSCWSFGRRGPSRTMPIAGVSRVRMLSQSGRCLLQEDGVVRCQTGHPPQWQTVEY